MPLKDMVLKNMIPKNMTRRNLLIALAGATGAVVTNAVAQKATSKEQDKFALANNDVKELLVLMDTDKNGKISKQEWMNFMEAEFNQLDKEGKGELDLKQLGLSRFSIKRTNS